MILAASSVITTTTITSSIVIFVILSVVLALAGTSATLALVDKVTQHKKQEATGIFTGIRQYFWRLLAMEILKTLAYVAVLLLAVVVMAVIYPFSHQISFFVAAIIFAVLAIHLYLGLLFRYPLLIRKQLSPLDALRHSYKLFHANKGRVFATAVLILVTFTVVDLIRSAILYLADIDLTWLFSFLYLLIVVWSFIYLFTVFPALQQPLPKKHITLPVEQPQKRVTRKRTKSRKR